MGKIGDKVKVKNCGYSYHIGEEGSEGIIIRIDKTKSFPVKLDNGNCYLEKCLEKILTNIKKGGIKCLLKLSLMPKK